MNRFLIWLAIAFSPAAGYALDFDGTNDYVDVGSAVVSGTPATICTWFKIDTRPGGSNIYTLVGVGTSGQASDILRLFLNDHTDTVVAQQYDGSTAGNADSTSDFSLNQWTHVCGAFSADNSRTIFINGVSEATNSESVTALNTLNYTSVGVLDWSTGRIQHFDGLIDDVRIYDRALSAAEITATKYGIDQVPRGNVGHWLLFESSGSNLTHPDISGNDNDGTGTGGAAGTVEGAPTTWWSYSGGN